MKRLTCDRESEVARAARTGFWPDGLRQHAEGCPACADTLVVTAALLEDLAHTRSDSAHKRADQPLEAAFAWLDARRRVRLRLRQRAMFWFRALRLIALLYLPVLVVWSITPHASAIHEAWKPSFRADFASLLTGPAEIFTLSGALLAALCVFLGSWYLLRETRATLQHSPRT